MICTHIRQELEPDRPVSKRARAHLSKCAACHAYFEEMRRLRSVLAELADVPVPDDFGHRLRARMHAQPLRPARLLVPWPRALAWTALGGIALALLFVLFPKREGQAPHEAALPPIPAPHSPNLQDSEPSSESQYPAPSSPRAPVARSPESFATKSLAFAGRTRVPSASLRPFEGPSPAKVSPTSRGASLLEQNWSSELLPQDGVILLLRNEETQEESVLAIPPVVFGSRPLVPRSGGSLPEGRRRIL